MFYPYTIMKCQICDTPFKTDGHYQLYCSKRCNKIAYYRRNKREILMKHQGYYRSTRKEVISFDFKCVHCGTPFSSFRKNRRFCSKKCLRNNWAKNHRDYMTKAVKSWRAKNQEKSRTYARRGARRRYATPEGRASYIHSALLQQSRRRNGTLGSHTLKEWNDLKQKFNFACVCCGEKEPDIKLSRDHIIPIIKGGTNFITNIQPLCLPCNLSKNKRSNCQRAH